MQKILSVLKKQYFKLLSLVLAIIMVFSLAVVPSTVAVTAAYLDERLFDFESNSGTLYAEGSTVTDSSDNSQVVAGKGFSQAIESNNGVLRIYDNLQEKNGTTTWFTLNDAQGLYELQANKSYIVSLRLKVVSNHVSFNNGVYPTSGQKTSVKLSYDFVTSALTSAVSSGDLITSMVKDTSTFQGINAEGVVDNLPIGKWLDMSFTFTTPAAFENDNALGFVVRTFNGADILIDDVYVARVPSVKLVTTKGTLATDTVPAVIGEKIVLPSPQYSKLGTDFDGWYLDSACTKKLTDKYYTAENCELTLYAGWTTERFSFESYTTPSRYSAPNYFLSIVENSDIAYDGNKYIYYHYTEEYWSKVYETNEETGAVTYYTSRRTGLENNIGLKYLSPYTTYVVTFKYRFPAGSGNVEAKLVTGDNNNIWHPGTSLTYTNTTTTLLADNSDEWRECRMMLTTGALAEVNNMSTDFLYLWIYANEHKHTEMYVDDVIVEEVEGDTTVTLDANGGTFADGENKKTVETAVGEELADFSHPTREEYDFDGWAYDKHGTEMVNTKVVDANVFRNTLYAVWSRNMGFEGYYYDLNSPDRNNYTSDTVSIVNDNVQNGNYSAKLSDTVGGRQNVIALNPVNNKTRYLVTFYYDLKSAASDIKVQFASMNYNINDSSDVTLYEDVYTIPASDKGKGYKMGAAIIETSFKNADANRLAMLVSSNSGAYNLYFDTVELTPLTQNEGYVILANSLTRESTPLIGKIGKEVKLPEPSNKNDKFMGWFADEALTSYYEGGLSYSETPNTIYTLWLKGEGFESFTPTSAGVTVTTDSTDKTNKYLTVNGAVSEKLATVTSGTRYGVEIRYSVAAASADTTVTLGGQSFTVTAADAGKGFVTKTFIVTAASNDFNLVTNGDASFSLLVDNLIIYEIKDNMSVVTFNQKDGYGEDSIAIGVNGTKIAFPEVSAHATDVFYGWYKDSALTTPYTSKVFDGDITLYGRWESNPVTNVSFDDLSDYENLPFTDANSKHAYVTSNEKKNGSYSLAIDRINEETTFEAYIPFRNKNGYIELESNTTYAISFWYKFTSYTSGAKINFNFYASSGETFTKGNVLGSPNQLAYSPGWKTGFAQFSTGDLAEGENKLYLYVSSCTINSMFYMDTVKITRVDEGRNHVFAYNPRKTDVLYEIDGNYGEEINFPNIDDNFYEVVGWYNDFEVTDFHESGLHKEEPVSELYSRFELKDLNFDNYKYENSDSKYTVGDDISLSYEEAYDTVRSLKYSYSPAIKYFETANNTAALGKVNDNSTYRISFMYKVTDAQSDVDIKFITAHETNRWAYITNYDKATYRIYSSEIGNDWARATVYLTTEFSHYNVNTADTSHLPASGLFMTFNPVVEGDTVVYIDAVEIDYLLDGAVTAFIGKNGNADYYVEGDVGDTVNAISDIPASQFSSFNGWYTDEELTQSFTSLTMAQGMNYVYSAWTEKAESFDNYTYASNNEANYASGNKIENGVLTYTAKGANTEVANGLRIGKLENNTSYKITFKYKTASSNLLVKFATADEIDIKVNTTAYNDQGNYITANADNAWHTETVYITSSFGYTVPKDEYVNAKDNKNASYGNMLYMYFENEAGAVISIDDIVVSEVDAVFSAGASVLTEEASKEAGSQAMRFFFSYKTDDIHTINIGGTDMHVVERGIIFKNARNTATGVIDGNTVKVSPIILANKNQNGYTYVSKSANMNNYWSYNSKTESLVYSAYIKDFGLTDSRLIGARGYIKVKDENGKVYTFYSADKKTTVKEGVELNSEITSTKVHTFAGVEWDEFKIVNPKVMPYIYGRQIEFLIDYAKETHNVVLNRYNERATENEYEIVIGDTTRAASDLVTVENENEYVIAVRGTKLIIKGGSDLATMQGVKDFISYLKTKDSLKCGADLKDGYTKYGKVSETGDNYKLTFNDDFNASTLDTKVWGAYNNQSKAKNYRTDSNLGGKISTISVGEGGYTTVSGRVVENSVGVRDGNMVLTTGRINDTDFTKGEVSSFWNMIYQYGYIEIKCKLGPPPSHVGWWMNGAGTGGASFIDRFGRENRGCMTEYDLLENYGRQDYYASAIHHWWSGTSIKDSAHVSLADSYGFGTKSHTYVCEEGETDMYGDYHIFTFLWENDRLIFAFDGVKYYEYINFDYYKDRMPNYIILSAGMGNRDYGVKYDPEKHGDYYETLIDYVRIYQQKDMGSVLKYAYDETNYAQ